MQQIEINNRLVELRTQLGISQKDMSQQLSVRQSYYSDLENGRRNVSNKFIDKVCSTLNVQKNWLYTGLGDIFTPKKGNFLYPDSVPPVVPNSSVQSNKDIEKAFEWNNEVEEWSKKYAQNRMKKIMANYETLELEFNKRLLTDIIQNHSKINGLQSDLNDLRIFKFIIENLDFYYFNAVDLQLNSVAKYLENGKFNYEDYKTAYLKELGKLEQIRPALHKISKAIKGFYKEIENFDTENIIKGYFGESINES